MIYVFAAIVLIVLALVATDILRNRHSLTPEEVRRLAAKRRRTRQISEFSFCVQPRTATPAEKKAMESTGEFVTCNLDFFEMPSRVAGLLKYKKHEWIVIAFIAQNRVLRFWWNKGPDGTRVWSFLPPEAVCGLVRSLKLDAIAILHNHPNPNPSRFRVNVPSNADLTSAAYFHRILVPIGGTLIEFICERGVPHLYYAAFAEKIVPAEPVVAEVARTNGRGVLSNYWLRKELARTTIGDTLPGAELPS